MKILAYFLSVKIRTLKLRCLWWGDYPISAYYIFKKKKLCSRVFSKGFDDDEDATLSAATTPSLLADCEPRLESCYCCPSHAEAPPEVPSDDPRFGFALPVRVTQASPEHARPVRRAHDPVSPRIQKQISLFEGNAAMATGQEKTESSGSVGGGAILHASINLPAAGPHHLRQDARLRKFENLTQSTSNSNFPFESNTLKRVPMQTTKDYDNVSHTQSCINLKSGSSGVLGGSPQRQRGWANKNKLLREANDSKVICNLRMIRSRS